MHIGHQFRYIYYFINMKDTRIYLLLIGKFKITMIYSYSYVASTKGIHIYQRDKLYKEWKGKIYNFISLIDLV